MGEIYRRRVIIDFAQVNGWRGLIAGVIGLMRMTWQVW